ncbi:helix-hairpin-helix domain-containing protein [Halobacteria archaeon HArc-gm2]|nr:helix-hairpin-helix domain-containing protein [Halobacteria archaeon HArc-gm2]
MTQTQFAHPKSNRTDFDIGLVFADQRTGDLRKVVYADDRVVLVRDETAHSTLVPRESFVAELDARYRRRPAADPDVAGGPFERLQDLLAEYDRQDGRKAEHKADALREALGRVENPDDDDEPVSPEVPFEAVDGIGPSTAAKLRSRGFVTEADVRTASDDALLGVAGVGPANLTAIREFVD